MMRILKTGLSVIGGLAIAFAALWLLLGKPVELPTNGQEAPRLTTNSTTKMAAADPDAQPAVCDATQTFHLERLKANLSLKVISLDQNGIDNVQRFLDLTMQNPPKLSAIPRVKVWVAWQYDTASLGGSTPAQGVIDIVQDSCVLYRRQGEAAEIVAIANGNWSR